MPSFVDVALAVGPALLLVAIAVRYRRGPLDPDGWRLPFVAGTVCTGLATGLVRLSDATGVADTALDPTLDALAVLLVLAGVAGIWRGWRRYRRGGRENGTRGENASAE